MQLRREKLTRGLTFVVLILLALTVIKVTPPLPPAQAGATAGKLVITSWGGSWEEFLRKEILPDFEKQFNTKVELSIGLSKDWIASMLSAGPERPPYDVVVTDEVWAVDLRRKGFYAKLPPDKVPYLKDIHPLARVQNDEGSLVLVDPIAIAYRTDLVQNPPKSWKDLWKPEYKGKIGLYTITNTAGAYFLMLTSKIWSGDPKNVDVGFAKIKELKPFHQVDFGGGIETQLTQGEIQIGILNIPAVARLKHQGIKIDYVIPSEGLMMFDEDMSVPKGSKNIETALAFDNYMLSPAVQEKWMRKFWSTPVNVKVTVPADLRGDVPIYGDKIGTILKWDLGWYNDHKEVFITRWNQEISQ